MFSVTVFKVGKMLKGQRIETGIKNANNKLCLLSISPQLKVDK